MIDSSARVPHTGRYVLHNTREEIERAETDLLQAIADFDYDRAGQFAVRMALEEALSNAFKHGNKSNHAKVVRLEYEINSNSVTIDIEDQGEGFDPDCVPDPTDLENVEIPCGRGLKLMKAFMTDVQIIPPGNRVRMQYVRPS